MSSTGRNSSDSSFVVEYNTDNATYTGTYHAHDAASATDAIGRYPIAYTCQQLLSNNQASEVEVEFYYELVRNKDDDGNDVLHRAETDTLNSVATFFGLDNGARCSVPPVHIMWLVRISSQPDDEPVNTLPCKVLKPGDNQICVVHLGLMTGYALGAGGTTDLIEYLQEYLHTAPSDDSYRMAFLETQIDSSALVGTTPYENLSPDYNAVNKEVTEQTESTRFTFLGGVLVALFALAVVGILFVLYRRRRKRQATRDVEIARPPERQKVQVEVGTDDSVAQAQCTFDLVHEMCGVEAGNAVERPPPTTEESEKRGTKGSKKKKERKTSKLSKKRKKKDSKEELTK